MKQLLLLFCLTLTTCAIAQPPGSSSAQVTAIRAGVLIDGKSDKPRRDQVILIRGNRIESVSDAGSVKIPAGAAVIDLSKETVLPGLIDSHTHIFLQGEDPAQGGYDANILTAPLALRAARATVAARRAVEQGFTTLRDVETEGEAMAMLASSRPLRAGISRGRDCWLLRARFRAPADIRSKGTHPSWKCRRGRRLSMDL